MRREAQESVVRLAQLTVGGGKLGGALGDPPLQLGAGGMQGRLRALALGDVGEGDHGAHHLLAIVDGIGRVLGGEGAAVAPPEHLVLDPAATALLERLEDPAVLHRHAGAVAVGVMDEVVHLPAEHLVRLVAKELGTDPIDEDAAPGEVDPVDPLSGGFEQHLELTPPGGVVGKVVQAREHQWDRRLVAVTAQQEPGRLHGGVRPLRCCNGKTSTHDGRTDIVASRGADALPWCMRGTPEGVPWGRVRGARALATSGAFQTPGER